MIDEKEVEVVKIDGKEFYVIATIDKYNYLSEISNPSNLIVLKECGEELISVKDDELDEALEKYYQNTSK